MYILMGTYLLRCQPFECGVCTNVVGCILFLHEQSLNAIALSSNQLWHLDRYIIMYTLSVSSSFYFSLVHVYSEMLLLFIQLRIFFPNTWPPLARPMDNYVQEQFHFPKHYYSKQSCGYTAVTVIVQRTTLCGKMVCSLDGHNAFYIVIQVTVLKLACLHAIILYLTHLG